MPERARGREHARKVMKAHAERRTPSRGRGGAREGAVVLAKGECDRSTQGAAILEHDADHEDQEALWSFDEAAKGEPSARRC